MRKSKFMIMLASLIMINSTNVFAATKTFSTDTTNTISTGDIEISLNEYELDSKGNRVEYINDKLVVPGQKVDKIVVIDNNAEKAWIRAKVEYNTSDGLDGMSDDMLDGMSKEWKKCGSYFYYTQPVEKESSIELFKGIVVPREWDEIYEDKGFSIGITAQAIQYSNFVPDFNSDNPWFGVPIEKCIHSSHDIYKVDGKNKFSVIFENGSEGFIKMGDDFFSNFNSLMPGDKVEDSIEIGNNTHYYIKLYFSTEVPEQSEESKKLLNDLKLVIKLDDSEIYKGSLSSKELEEGIRLGTTYRKGDRSKLKYIIEMPAELTNSSAMQMAKVKWIFRTEYNTGGSGGGGGNPGGNPGGGGNISTITDNTPPKGDTNVDEPDLTAIDDNDTPLIEKITNLIMPKTGDETHRGIFYLLILVCGGLNIILLVKEGKSKNKKENKNEQQ